MNTFNLLVIKQELLFFCNNNEVILSIFIIAIAIILFFITRRRILIFIAIVTVIIFIASLNKVGNSIVINRICEPTGSFDAKKITEQDLFTLQSYYKFHYIEAKEHQGLLGGTRLSFLVHQICEKIKY